VFSGTTTGDKTEGLLFDDSDCVRKAGPVGVLAPHTNLKNFSERPFLPMSD
jgi:hypothetical protein